MFDKLLDFVPEIPIADWTTRFTDWITDTFSFLFTPIKEHFGSLMEVTSDLLLKVPPIFIILIVALIFFFITGKRFGLAIFSIIGLWLIYNQGYCDHLISTYTLCYCWCTYLYINV